MFTNRETASNFVILSDFFGKRGFGKFFQFNNFFKKFFFAFGGFFKKFFGFKGFFSFAEFFRGFRGFGHFFEFRNFARLFFVFSFTAFIVFFIFFADSRAESATIGASSIENAYGVNACLDCALVGAVR